MKTTIPTNYNISQLLEEIAQLLEFQHANPHRIRAYRRAAKFIREREGQLLEDMIEGNVKDLQDLPGIGESLSRLIDEYIRTGKSRLLQRLQGEIMPEELFDEIPNIGPGTCRPHRPGTRHQNIRGTGTSRPRREPGKN